MRDRILKRIFFIGALQLLTSLAIADTHILKLQPGTQLRDYELENNVKLKEIASDLGLYEAVEQTQHRIRTFSFLSRQTIDTSTVYRLTNHPVQLRKTASVISNDPLLQQQWNWQSTPSLVGINALESWNLFGTGGLDASAQEIVVAIVDGGFDVSHPDLYMNRWRNRGEIIGNQKDDDGNGFVDDINGWNAQTNSGKIENADHGTHVAGIIGARGNNLRGITGLNWRVKLMYVSLGDDLGDTASTLRAYNYILKQKQLWLQSGGTKGANVVAINSSFGIDATSCAQADFVVWNEMMEELGSVGILSVAATSNLEIDVDKHGDIPTSCESSFLISVTNSLRNGQKSSSAGFGAVSIDLAAPGTDILSTAQRRTTSSANSSAQLYSAQSGTSFSAPHVAGAVAYLYSVAPQSLALESRNNPSAVALKMKEALLASVTAVAELKDITASGGVLNIFEAAKRIREPSLVIALHQ